MSSPSAEDVLERSLRRVEWQPVVLGDSPRRLDLLRLAPDWPTRQIRVRVHRNTAVEHVASLLPPFLAYAGLSATVEPGGYDDSLSAAGGADADVEVVWLDHERYGDADPAGLADWLRDRLHVLRAGTPAPLLVVDHPGTGPVAEAVNARLAQCREELPGLAVADLSAIARRLGEAFRDDRGRDVAATGMSARAAVLTAQRMGLRWLPALLTPRVKALAVDLDMTLYDGVLGEDGPEGVRLTSGHEALQRALRQLRGDGVLLTLVSRNEPADVDALFAARPDFPLRSEDFSARAVGWGAKSEGVAAVAAELHIAPDAVVFVDDNVGELAEVAAGAGVRGLVHAADPAATVTALAHFPGLHGYQRTDEDALRAADLAAGARRATPAGTDPAAYLASLQVRVDFSLDDAGRLPRMAALAAKTNQFNTSLHRSTEAELARRLTADDAAVVTASLRDRLSDSGVVALVAGRRGDDGSLLVEELCISCRALGRGIEDVLVAAAVGRLLEECGGDAVDVVYRPGPRNEPARAWLETHACGPVRDAGPVRLTWTAATCRELVERSPVHVTWEGQP